MHRDVKEMEKQELYGQLLPKNNQYQVLHPRTAETDLSIIKLFAYGKSVIQITMEIPCSEATVYRAIHRVKDFPAE